MNEGYDISLVIPCYNEEKNVSLFYKECSCIFNKNKLPTNLLVNIYAHSLYCLALYDKQKVYEEFII